MPIEVGDRPLNDPPADYAVNKFMGYLGEGHRGIVLSRRHDRKAAIVAAMTESNDPGDGIEWGCLYEVQEMDEYIWPKVVRQVDTIVPSREMMEWHIITERHVRPIEVNVQP